MKNKNTAMLLLSSIATLNTFCPLVQGKAINKKDIIVGSAIGGSAAVVLLGGLAIGLACGANTNSKDQLKNSEIKENDVNSNKLIGKVNNSNVNPDFFTVKQNISDVKFKNNIDNDLLYKYLEISSLIYRIFEDFDFSCTSNEETKEMLKKLNDDEQAKFVRAKRAILQSASTVIKAYRKNDISLNSIVKNAWNEMKIYIDIYERLKNSNINRLCEDLGYTPSRLLNAFKSWDIILNH